MTHYPCGLPGGGTVTGGGTATTDASQLTSGILPAARIADGSITDAKLTNGTALTSTERTKLAGVANGATANGTDAQLRDRSTHTGTQTASTVTGLAAVATSGAYADLAGTPTIPAAYTDEQAQDAAAALFAAGAHTGATVTYNDAANSLSIAVTGGGGGAATPFVVPTPQVGEWAAMAGGVSGIGSPANAVIFSELWLGAGTYDSLLFNVSAAAAGATARVGVYSDSSGKPDTLLLAPAAVDATATGAKQITGLSLVLTSTQRVWLAVVGQGAGIGFSGVNTGYSQTLWNFTPTGNITYASPPNVWSQSGVTGALPTTAAVNGRPDYGYRVAVHRSV